MNLHFIIFSGALNGIIKHNLKEINYEMVSLNFHDMNDFKDTLYKFKESKKGEEKDENKPGNHLKRYFNYEDKLVMLAPFSYSADKEKVTGFNDD